MAKHYHERGEANAVIVVCLVVALIGALGWIFWQNFIAKDFNQNSTEQAIARADKDADKTKDLDAKIAQRDEVKDESAADPSEGGKYLVITQWGVRMPLTSATAGAYYEFSDAKTLTLSTKPLAKMSANCGVNGTAPVGGSLKRGKKGEVMMVAPSGAEIKFGSNGETKVGDYYYFYMNPQSTCSDDGRRDLEVMADFRKQIKSLEAY